MKLLLGILVAGSAGGVAWADKLTLGDEARLTGTVRSINEQGTVELSSVLSAEPLLLRAAVVEKVEFTPPEAAAPVPETLVELTNGDLLPVSIEGLDATTLQVTTPDAGSLAIPKSAVKSLQMGVRQKKHIYSGPHDLEEWSQGADGDKNWRFADGALVATGPARASKEFKLPPRFILKFTLKWRANPNFQIYFADPLTAGGERLDRYYLQFNSGGIEIKRESTQGKRFQSVILLPRTPEQFPDNEVNVEIRVDRKASRLHLLLNDEPEVAGFDPFPDKPDGNGVAILSISPAGTNQEISGIEILDYDNARSRHLAEDRGDLKADSLISREDDRWGGTLTGIRKTGAGTIFSFKSDFQEEPLEIPEIDVSTLFFAQPEAGVAEAPARAFSLRLRGEGSLQVSSCWFSEEKVMAVHPLLGTLTLNRAGVSALERLKSEPGKKSE